MNPSTLKTLLPLLLALALALPTGCSLLVDSPVESAGAIDDNAATPNNTTSGGNSAPNTGFPTPTDTGGGGGPPDVVVTPPDTMGGGNNGAMEDTFVPPLLDVPIMEDVPPGEDVPDPPEVVEDDTPSDNNGNNQNNNPQDPCVEGEPFVRQWRGEWRGRLDIPDWGVNDMSIQGAVQFNIVCANGVFDVDGSASITNPSWPILTAVDIVLDGEFDLDLLEIDGTLNVNESAFTAVGEFEGEAQPDALEMSGPMLFTDDDFTLDGDWTAYAQLP